MHESEIAILLATYNGANFIREQIQSIINQTYKKWKLYIHDDGSNDDTLKIIMEFINIYPDKIFYVDGSSTGSAKSNFFYLLRMVHSNIYMFCDQDDVWLENKIMLTIDSMKKIYAEDKPCMVFTDLKVVDVSLNIVSDKMSVYQKLNCKDNSINRRVVQNVVTGCTMMINRNLRDYMIAVEDEEDIIMHDWWAALIASQFGVISYIDECTILYRQHGNNSVGAKQFNLKYKLFVLLKNRCSLRKSVSDTWKQAEKFVKVYNISSNELIYKFSKLSKSNKLVRIITYIRYRFFKSSLSRNLGLIIFG